MDENIRLRDKAVQQSQVFFRLQIERRALLAAVEPNEVRRHPLYGQIVMARSLAFGTLDLDDARAGVGKANRAQGRRHGLLNRNDQEPRERAGAESSRGSDIPLNSGPRDDPGLQPLVRAVILGGVKEEPWRVFDIEKTRPVVVEVALTNLRADTPWHVGDERFNDVETAISEQTVVHGPKHCVDIAIDAVRRIRVS